MQPRRRQKGDDEEANVASRKRTRITPSGNDHAQSYVDYQSQATDTQTSPVLATAMRPVALFLRAAGLPEDGDEFEMHLDMKPHSIHVGELATMHNVSTTRFTVRFASAGRERAELTLRPEQPLAVTVNKIRVAQMLTNRRFRRQVLNDVVARNLNIWDHLGVTPRVAPTGNDAVPRGNLRLHAVGYAIDVSRARFRLRLDYEADMATRTILRLASQHHEHLGGNTHRVEFDAPFAVRMPAQNIEQLVLATARRWLAVFATPHLLDALAKLVFQLDVFPAGEPLPVLTLRKFDLAAILAYFERTVTLGGNSCATETNATWAGHGVAPQQPAPHTNTGEDDLRLRSQHTNGLNPGDSFSSAGDANGEPELDSNIIRALIASDDEDGEDRGGAVTWSGDGASAVSEALSTGPFGQPVCSPTDVVDSHGSGELPRSQGTVRDASVSDPDSVPQAS